MTLQEIELPYGDEEALAYLNHLRIVVAERKEATASAEEVAAPLSTTGGRRDRTAFHGATVHRA